MEDEQAVDALAVFLYLGDVGLEKARLAGRGLHGVEGDVLEADDGLQFHDQKAVVDSMQTRMDLYDYLGYHDYEQKLDALFAENKNL